MGQRCCRQYEMFQGRINWIKLAGGLNTQQKQAQHSRARESKEPGPPASRLVVGSSRARMPQLRQNVSASARRMMRQASTWWRRWRVVAGGGGGGREVLCALPCRLSRVRQALLLFQSVLGRRTLQTSLYNSPTPMQRPPPPPPFPHLLARRAAAAHIQLRLAAVHHHPVVVGAPRSALRVRLDLRSRHSVGQGNVRESKAPSASAMICAARSSCGKMVSWRAACAACRRVAIARRPRHCHIARRSAVLRTHLDVVDVRVAVRFLQRVGGLAGGRRQVGDRGQRATVAANKLDDWLASAAAAAAEATPNGDAPTHMCLFIPLACHSSLTIVLMSAILEVWKLSRAFSRACTTQGGRASQRRCLGPLHGRVRTHTCTHTSSTPSPPAHTCASAHGSDTRTRPHARRRHRRHSSNSSSAC